MDAVHIQWASVVSMCFSAHPLCATLYLVLRWLAKQHMFLFAALWQGCVWRPAAVLAASQGGIGLPRPGLVRLQASYLRVFIVYASLLCPQQVSFLRALPWQKKNVYEAELGSTSPSIGEEIAMWQRWLTQIDPCSHNTQPSKRRYLKQQAALSWIWAGHVYLVSCQHTYRNGASLLLFSMTFRGTEHGEL